MLSICVPSAGQGALAIECRAEDHETHDAVAFLDHADTRFAVTAERTALNALGGGCQVPIGMYCRREGETFRISGVVASPEGREHVAAATTGMNAKELRPRDSRGIAEERCGRHSLRRQAGLMSTASPLPLAGKRIVVTRARTQASSLVAALTELGAEVIELPTIEIVPLESYEVLDEALRNDRPLSSG